MSGFARYSIPLVASCSLLLSACFDSVTPAETDAASPSGADSGQDGPLLDQAIISLPAGEAGETGVDPPDPPPPENPVPPVPEPPQNSLGTVPPDDQTLARAEASTSTSEFAFETAETVDGLSYGLIGDGSTDNTDVFRRLLAGGNRTIHVPAGDYVTHSLELESNTRLILDPGVTLRDAGRLAYGERLLNIKVDNVHIRALGARVLASRTSYSSGEQRHGVYVYGGHRVLIEGLESSGHGGDGFYIGGGRDDPSTDVMLSGCRSANNRRQGLSVTSARRVRVVDCEFLDTNGTAPEYGIDLEPNYPFDVLKDILIVRPYTRGNRGGDIMITLHALDASSEPADISIIDHASATVPADIHVYVAPHAAAIVRYSRVSQNP